MILLVDDCEDLRTLFRHALQHEGHAVLEASEGAEALALLAERGPDIRLVITDAVMPRVGGRELVWRLSEDHPHLPVILMSGILSPEQIGLGDDLPPWRFVAKPCAPRDLLQVVDEVLSARS